MPVWASKNNLNLRYVLLFFNFPYKSFQLVYFDRIKIIYPWKLHYELFLILVKTLVKRTDITQFSIKI